MEFTKTRFLLAPVLIILALLLFPASPLAAVLYPTGTYNSTGSSVSIVDTNYPVPSGAKFVSTSGSDTTGTGTLSNPWRTVAKAIASTATGGTIVIRGGNYNESVKIANKRLTLQPYPGESVWFKGSTTITGWVKESTTVWRKDGYTFKSDHSRPSGYPYTPFPYPDVVAVNGVGLNQVYSKAELTAGTFYIDQAGSKLYLGTDPSNKTVDASNLKQALYVSTSGADGSIIRGIGFKHYASGPLDGAAVRIVTAEKVQILDCTFAWNGGRGLAINGNTDGIVRGNTMVFNGDQGFYAGSGDRLLVERNAIANNPSKPWSTSWNASNLKLFKARDMVVRDNLVEKSIGKGLWLDESVLNVVVVRNTLRQNQMGMQFEIGAGGVIASNLVYDNTSRGILISSSGASYTMKMYVYNNTFFNNKAGDLRVWETERANTDSEGLSQGITFNVTGVQVKNNLFANSLAPQLISSEDRTNTLSSSQMIESMDYNGYWRKSNTTTKTMILWTKTVGGTPTKYATVPLYKTANSPNESHSKVFDLTATDPYFYNAAAGDFRLKAGSSAIGAGTTLPSVIASALGVSTGVNQNLGALLGIAGEVAGGTPEVPTGNLTSVDASADTYVRDGTASSNYGTVPTLLSKTARASLNRISYIKFNISQIGSSIQSAKLRLYARLDGTGTLESEILGVPDTSWTESGMTWNNRPGMSVNLGRVLVEGSTYQIYEMDLTDYVKQAKASGSTYVSIALSNPEMSERLIEVQSREGGSNAPELVIQTSN